MVCLCQDKVKSKKRMSQKPQINSNNNLNSFLLYETFSFPIFKYEITNKGYNSVIKKNNGKLSSIITKSKLESFTKEVNICSNTHTNRGHSSFLNNSISFLSFLTGIIFNKFLLCKFRVLWRHAFLKVGLYVSPS